MNRLSLFLYALVFKDRIKQQHKIVSALEGYVQNVYWAEELNEEESKRNLEDSVIELLEGGKHSSNGLLITDDGFFLTARHCVEGINNLSIRTSDGNEYSFEKVLAKGKKEDIVLAKAAIPAECKPKKYKFFDSNSLPTYSTALKMPLALLTRRDGELIVKGGYFRSSRNNHSVCSPRGEIVKYTQQLSASMDSKPGDSGGALVTPDGRLVGIFSSGGDLDYSTTSVKLFKALELISFHKGNRQQKYHLIQFPKKDK